MPEHDYCRTYLKEVMLKAKRCVTSNTIKNSWSYKYDGERLVEFHINKCPEVPEGFFWSGRGCCLWMAKALGWEAFFKNLEEQNERP